MIFNTKSRQQRSVNGEAVQCTLLTTDCAEDKLDLEIMWEWETVLRVAKEEVLLFFVTHYTAALVINIFSAHVFWASTLILQLRLDTYYE